MFRMAAYYASRKPTERSWEKNIPFVQAARNFKFDFYFKGFKDLFNK